MVWDDDDEMREGMSRERKRERGRERERERESTCGRCIGGILSCCIACGCLFCRLIYTTVTIRFFIFVPFSIFSRFRY